MRGAGHSVLAFSAPECSIGGVQPASEVQVIASTQVYIWAPGLQLQGSPNSYVIEPSNLSQPAPSEEEMSLLYHTFFSFPLCSV